MREKRHQILWPKRFLSSADNNGLQPGAPIVSGSHTGESRELMTSHLNTILLWYTTALWVFRFCPRPKTPPDNAAFRPFKLVGYLQIKYWKSHRGLAPSHPIHQVNRSINWDSWEPLGNICGVSGLDVWLDLSGTILCFENMKYLYASDKKRGPLPSESSWKLPVKAGGPVLPGIHCTSWPQHQNHSVWRLLAPSVRYIWKDWTSKTSSGNLDLDK